MAATSTKPVLSALKTPLSATYPSELQSPLVGTPTTALVKREECDLKTPITPPTAYLDFLKTFSPVLMSPLATGTSSRFSFAERPASIVSSHSSYTSVSSAPSIKDEAATDNNTAEKPASPGVTSNASRASSCCSCDSQQKHPRSSDEETEKASDNKDSITSHPSGASTKSSTPQSPFVKPLSARTPRRLHIPQSPYSPASVRSPMSAHSVQSPYSTTMSPREWDWDKAKVPGSANSSRAVSVRQVVTRTVTYTRTPVEGSPPAQLDPAPKGKRRKIA